MKSDSAIEEDDEISESAAEDALLDAVTLQRLEGETDEEWAERGKVDDEARQERASRRDARSAKKRRGVFDESVDMQDEDSNNEGDKENGGLSKEGLKQV